MRSVRGKKRILLVRTNRNECVCVFEGEGKGMTFQYYERKSIKICTSIY